MLMMPQLMWLQKSRTARTAEDKLGGQDHTRSEGHGHYLIKRQKTGDKQDRVASKCGTGCGL